ncbi:hypothetical protein D3C87_976710 [compost metagenome]
MDKETKILICEMYYGQQMTIADISTATGEGVNKISYMLTSVLVFRNPDLYENECLIKQSKINDDNYCGD